MLNTVKLTREDLRQAKYEKVELERTLRLRKQTSDKMINDLQHQLEDEKVHECSMDSISLDVYISL